MKKRVWIFLAVLLLMTMAVGCMKNGGNDTETISTEGSQVTEAEAENTEACTDLEDGTELGGTAAMEEELTETVTQTETTTEEEKEIILDESKAVSVWTTASTLNLRKAANTSADVLKVLKRGTEIKKYDEKDGWALVKAGDVTGYVSAQYIANEKPQEPTTQKKEETKPADKEDSADKGQGGGSKVEAIPGQHRNPNSAVVVIDPGHQRKGDSTKEPNGPGSSTMKARVTYGTTGVATGVTEYILNLDIGMKLKTELQNRGYTVYMTRTSHDVNISNKERAEYGNSVGADAVIRIHANSSDNSSVKGAETLSPSSKNPYISHLAKASQKLGKCVIDAYCKATGFKNRGMKTDDTMTGINWSEIPVTIIELGFMSNAEEDKAMQDSTMQNNMVQGIANGLDDYFGF